MKRFFITLLTVACLAMSAQSHAASHATSFASQVINYTPGTIESPVNTAGVALADPTAALGSPHGIVGESGAALFGGFPSPNVLSPFSPGHERDEIVQVGAGGIIELRLNRFVEIGVGPEIGVFSNFGLTDAAYPNGTATSPAGSFSPAGKAVVEVSTDGNNWSALNGGLEITFDMPTMFYTNAGPFDGTPPAAPALADFGKPFTPAGGLSAFDGLTYPESVTLMDGTGGGTWLDLDATGLDRVGFIRFSVPAGALGSLGETTFELDAVSIASSKAGALVPEPASSTLCLLALAVSAMLRERRRV